MDLVCYALQYHSSLLAMGIALFSYYCVMIYHKLHDLKQHILIISQFLTVRSLGTALQGPLLRGSLGRLNLGVCWALCSSEAQLGKYLLLNSLRFWTEFFSCSYGTHGYLHSRPIGERLCDPGEGLSLSLIGCHLIKPGPPKVMTL